MERRKFLKATAIGSACMLAGSATTKNALAKEEKEEFTCKISILKKSLNSDWCKEFRNSEGKKCEFFTEGQEFMVESAWETPTGFCQWAWADIRTYIHMVNQGKFNTFVTCCTDGFRPVFFKIERIKKD